MRVLITGASGFAGRWLAQACAAAGDTALGVSRSGRASGVDAAVDAVSVDLVDGSAVRSTVREFGPEVVYHLAALSSVGRSWEEPGRTLRENGESAVNVLEAVRLEAPEARLVWVSSCEVYGADARLPAVEDEPLRPANPYAVSKAAGELLASVYADAYGLDLVCARPFNHTGPGQPSVFVVSSLARQAAEARLAGRRAVQIVTGNPDTRRDFLDVRDTVRAYRLLAAQAPAAVYNVSSGRSVSTAELVALVGSLIAPIEVEHIVAPNRVRAHEVMDLRGSHERLTDATGWRPELALKDTVAEMIAYWEQELARARETEAGSARG